MRQCCCGARQLSNGIRQWKVRYQSATLISHARSVTRVMPRRTSIIETIPRGPKASRLPVWLQQYKVPVPGEQVGSFLGTTGVTEAETLLATAMAATQERRDLWNNIEKKADVVVKFSVCSRKLRNSGGLQLPFYKISSRPGGKMTVKTSALTVNQTEIHQYRAPERGPIVRRSKATCQVSKFQTKNKIK